MRLNNTNQRKPLEIARINGFILLLIISLFFVPGIQAQPLNWVKLIDKQQVQVFKLSVSGEPDRFLAQTSLKTTPQALLALLKDTKNSHLWIENSLGVTLIKKLSENENIVYTRLRSPWPFKNRDMVNYTHYWQDRRTCALFINVIARPEALKRDPDFTRITDFKAAWSVYPTSSTHSMIRYSGWVDPGGLIPEFVSTHVATHSLFNTFNNLRNILPNSKYQQYLFNNAPCTPSLYYKS